MMTSPTSASKSILLTIRHQRRSGAGAISTMRVSPAAATMARVSGRSRPTCSTMAAHPSSHRQKTLHLPTNGRFIPTKSDRKGIKGWFSSRPSSPAHGRLRPDSMSKRVLVRGNNRRSETYWRSYTPCWYSAICFRCWSVPVKRPRVASRRSSCRSGQSDSSRCSGVI